MTSESRTQSRVARLAAISAASMAVAAFALPAHAETKSWRITNIEPEGRVHLRQTPSNRSKILAYIPGNMRGLTRGPCNGKWCRIAFRGFTGWVYSDYLSPDDESPEETVAGPLNVEAASPGIQDLTVPSALKLADGEGRPVAVYAFPNDKLPAAGLLPAGTEAVESLGACTRDWCYIRSGSLVGWVARKAFTADEGALPGEERVPQEAVGLAVDETLTTATIATPLIGQIGASDLTPNAPGEAAGRANKLYTLAGVGGERALPVYENADSAARIVGWIPHDAGTVEGLKSCIEKWCLVRWDKLRGWVARRHLADPQVVNSQRFQVGGLPLWTPLNVLDRPAKDAEIVGAIPSYASGLVPIGGCDATWCHIRYLGLAGWVSGEYLRPEKR